MVRPERRSGEARIPAAMRRIAGGARRSRPRRRATPRRAGAGPWSGAPRALREPLMSAEAEAVRATDRVHRGPSSQRACCPWVPQDLVTPLPFPLFPRRAAQRRPQFAFSRRALADLNSVWVTGAFKVFFSRRSRSRCCERSLLETPGTRRRGMRGPERQASAQGQGWRERGAGSRETTRPCDQRTDGGQKKRSPRERRGKGLSSRSPLCRDGTATSSGHRTRGRGRVPKGTRRRKSAESDGDHSGFGDGHTQRRSRAKKAQTKGGNESEREEKRWKRNNHRSRRGTSERKKGRRCRRAGRGEGGGEKETRGGRQSARGRQNGRGFVRDSHERAHVSYEAKIRKIHAKNE